MTADTAKTLQAMVRDFFTHHLVIERNVSSNTVIAYRDAIRLFLTYTTMHLQRTADELNYDALDVEVGALLSQLAGNEAELWTSYSQSAPCRPESLR